MVGFAAGLAVGQQQHQPLEAGDDAKAGQGPQPRGGQLVLAEVEAEAAERWVPLKSLQRLHDRTCLVPSCGPPDREG